MTLKPCEIWTGALDGKKRYGIRGFEGTTTSAHRVAFCNEHGLSLKNIKGLDVCHECDNPLCVNVDHLWLGTRQANMQDAKQKGRMSTGESHREALKGRDFEYDEEHARRTSEGAPNGEAHYNCKITDAQVKALSSLWKTGLHSQRALAKRFGISQSNVSLIVNGKTRKAQCR